MSNPHPPTLTTPPPAVRDVAVTFPTTHPHVVLVTLDRAAQLNSVPRWLHGALERLWDWYDAEPSLRCAVLTGAGGKAFCAGADLKEWDGVMAATNGSEGGSTAVEATITQDGTGAQGPAVRSTTTTTTTGEGYRGTPMPAAGFGGMSNRGGKKPIVAAVDGICFGGGMEMALNCDLVVASSGSVFGLPEVGVGVVALAGALPRLARSVGRQRAMEMALAARRYSAREMRDWGLVNEVVETPKEKGEVGYSPVVSAALRWADSIAANSPDAVIVSREGVKLGWEGVSPEVATDIITKGWWARIEGGENMVEGVKSFVERRKPVWKNSKL